MPMEAELLNLARDLSLSVVKEWLQDLAAHPSLSTAPAVRWKELLVAHFLRCDLNTAGAGCLPADIKLWHNRVLRGPCVLQVDELANMAVCAKQRYEQDGRNRCLKLLLTDGHQQVCGIEQSRLGMLTGAMPVGFKVLLSNVLVRRGLMLLTPENIKLLGGQVDRLEEARKRALQRWAQRPTGQRQGGQGEENLYAAASRAAWPAASTLPNPELDPPEPAHRREQPGVSQAVAILSGEPGGGAPAAAGDRLRPGACPPAAAASQNGIAHQRQLPSGSSRQPDIGRLNAVPPVGSGVTADRAGAAATLLAGPPPQDAPAPIRGLLANGSGERLASSSGSDCEESAPVPTGDSDHDQAGRARTGQALLGCARPPLRPLAVPPSRPPPGVASATELRKTTSLPAVTADLPTASVLPLTVEDAIVLDSTDSEDDSPILPASGGQGRAATACVRPNKRPRVNAYGGAEEPGAHPMQSHPSSEAEEAGGAPLRTALQGNIPAHYSEGSHVTVGRQHGPASGGWYTQATAQTVRGEDACSEEQLRNRAGAEGKSPPVAHSRRLESIQELQRLQAFAPTSAFPMVVALEGVVKNARTGLHFIDDKQQPLREYSMAATISDGHTDAPVILSHTLLQEILGVKLLDLWTLLREQGKDAVRAHLDRLKFFLASFKGVFQLHISDASSEPGVLECVPFDA